MVVPKINSAHGSDTRNIINAAIEAINTQGKTIQDLVAEGQLTPAQYAELITVINGLLKSGEVSVHDIDINRGKLLPRHMSEELLQMIAGDAPVNAVPADGSITNIKVANKAVTPDKTTMFKSTKNLFNGVYYPYYIAGVKGGNSLLYNTNPNFRTAVVPIQSGQGYTVKIYDTNYSNAFRLAEHTVKNPKFNEVGVTNLTTLIEFNDQLKEYTFTASLTGYAFITVSKDNTEPKLQVEKGNKATEYIAGYLMDEEYLPTTALDLAQEVERTANEAFQIAEDYRVRSNNLFDGNYHPYYLAGVKGSTALIYNTDPNSRTAIIPIVKGKSYTVKIHEPKKTNRFLLATHTSLPNFNTLGVANLTSLLEYNNVLKEFKFVADVSGYAYVTVSSEGQEPKMMFEEGTVNTPYRPYYVIKNEYINHVVDENETITNVQNESNILEEKLKERELFPTITQSEMVGTDPGARFIEYFDGKMWGYTFVNKDISYSIDEGRTWVVHTRLPSDVSVPTRLLPTDDGEVLLMSSSNIHKSIGWNSENVTWTSGKINKHANATLFQFSFDGDGKKFIAVEYANGTSRWKDSRYVWISTDSGNTFNVVWDSLEEHGEEINNLTHLHSACYDRWADRFYFTQGHSPGGGLYCSTDDGATWIQAKGHRDGVLASQGIVAKDGDTNGPTVVIATPTGLVMGSDNANNGMFGLVRKDNPEDEVVTRTYKADYDGAGVTMFAIRGYFDEASGTVYVAFRSELNNVPPIICAGTPTSAEMIYEYPNLPVRGAEDHFGAIAKIGDDKIVAYAQFGGQPYTFRGNLTYPNTEIQVMVRNELKRLGLI